MLIYSKQYTVYNLIYLVKYKYYYKALEQIFEIYADLNKNTILII